MVLYLWTNECNLFSLYLLNLKYPLLNQIRVQMETLLAEKSRLAQENSTYARENRFLREIVDFHQFTTHDVVSLDDGDMGDSEPEEDNNLIRAENVLPVVEEISVDEVHSPVPSRPESPTVSLGESSSPKSNKFPQCLKARCIRFQKARCISIWCSMMHAILVTWAILSGISAGFGCELRACA